VSGHSGISLAGEGWVDVGRVPDLRPREIRRVEIAGQVLALVHLEGEVYAVSGVCPHQGGPLDQGTIWEGELQCPWHHFLFDVKTGANVYPANVYPEDMPQLRLQLKPLRVFPVRVDGGRVYVKLGEPSGPGL
jgi:nitrite reductase/ring-hydroxylating ferredoxin subunit